jgi:hypothetical protein
LLTTWVICPLAADSQTPQRVATTTTKVTIPSPAAFTQALPSASRNSCTIQYNGTTTGYVYFGVLANATTTNSFQLTAGQVVSCGNVDGTVLTDQVSVDGTAGDVFVVTTQ